MYLLDTNACIRLLNGSSPSLAERLRREGPRQVRLCSVVKAELLFGASKSARVRENHRVLTAFFAPFRCLPFDEPAAVQYGEIRAHLEKAGTPIGPNDLLIASISRANDLTLVTHNTREFSRVPGLGVEDWE